MKFPNFDSPVSIVHGENFYNVFKEKIIKICCKLTVNIQNQKPLIFGLLFP